MSQMRMFIKRFTQLSMDFSKKLSNLAAAAIHVDVYNFCRIHGSLKMALAMVPGVIRPAVEHQRPL